MNKLYEKTFSQIEMPKESMLALRSALASKCSDNETEVPMKRFSFRRHPAALLAAVILIAALSVTALACGGAALYRFLTGGTITQAESYTEVSIGTEFSPIEEQDGHVYLTVSGERLDITDQFSYEIPYIYDCVAADGLRHVLIVGGAPDAIGWSEFIFDESGMPLGGSASFGTPNGTDDAPWLDAAKEQLDLPW